MDKSCHKYDPKCIFTGMAVVESMVLKTGPDRPVRPVQPSTGSTVDR